MKKNDTDYDYVYIVREPERLLNTTYANRQTIYNNEILTTISKDTVAYLYNLLHKELDDQGLWSLQEENALDTIEYMYEYFFESDDDENE